MPEQFLDMSTLHTTVNYPGTWYNLPEFVASHRGAIEALAAEHLVKSGQNFGFAMAAPMWAGVVEPIRRDQEAYWDNPVLLAWLFDGWGPDRDRYIANALRKLPAMFRKSFNDTLGAFEQIESTLVACSDYPGHFRRPVSSSDEDGRFPWGDYPYGGGARVTVGPLTLVGAVSGLKPWEDDMMARLIITGLAHQILDAESPPPHS